MENEKKFWEQRAKKYNNLEWVSKDNIIQALLLVCNLKDDYCVLDAGCGTGRIACTISKFVKEVHGLDISEAMLSKIDKNKFPNLHLKVGEIKKTGYPDNTFDLVVARLVFHHILDDDGLLASVKECFRILKHGGRLIISEGVPPHEDLKKDYEEIFKLKEKRRTFMPEDLRELLFKGGFKYVRLHITIDEHMSVKNWLENAGNLSPEVINKIMDMHRHSSEQFRKYYNLKEEKGDILIDVKVVIAVGVK